MTVLVPVVPAGDPAPLDWVRYDGARLVADTAASLGLTVTGPPETPGQWGQAWTSASDTATVLATLEDSLQPDDAATLLGWMRATTPLAADGFDLLNADWSSALGVAGLAGLVSLLKGLIASRVGDNPGPSLVDSERVVTSPQHLA